jgi:hypothetical protein
MVKDNKELNEEERIRWRAVAWATMCYLAVLMMAVLLCIMLGGCTTTKYVTVPEYHTDTLKVSHNVHDSIYVHDSVWVSEQQRGDTILLTTTKWLTKYVERLSHDTIYQSKTDSVPAPYPVEVKVPAEMTWWQQTRMHVGGVVLALLLMWLAVRLVNLWREKRG